MAEKNEITLVADTSGDPLKMALAVPGVKILFRQGSGRRQEELLLKYLDSMLAVSRLKLEDIGRVVVVRGPGRFTGIRIGLTLASVLKKLSGARACGVTVFEALAFQLMGEKCWRQWLSKNPGGRLAIVVHAFRDEYFAAVFKPGFRQDGPEGWFSRPQLLDFLRREKKRSPLLCAGSADKGAPLSTVLDEGEFELAPHRKSILSASTLIKMKGRASLEPLYLKPAKYELL
ncbi:MAG: tRNA (adenosine(37)-N6)-threonylcarbamoyltransferase complex dimerization subunit type 1 TsaB [Elusimicrobia bacterium]|nr:tRNA (adenosine(37)-N6)-threonylcarbamoyltransferase complex dimerization subunit type 1 TsaB [Elusimicrobiota bacterium]